MKNLNSTIACCAASLLMLSAANGYEINNHATMADTALRKSVIQTDGGSAGKLFRLGLKQLALDNTKQRFPRSVEGAPERECYGFTKLDDGSFLKAELDVAEPPDLPGSANAGATGYTLIDLLRFGVCYEDNNELATGFRSLAHFYDPQNGGGLLGNPASPDWALTGTANASTGVNHFSYADTRTAFFEAVTKPAKVDRDKSWGLTFQALGHVIHHLEDMAQPQHVRKDDHCDSSLCRWLGQYKPSGYEKYAGDARRIALIRSLAASATTPIVFGLPRDFWSSGPTVAGYQNIVQGIAGYTSTNYVSAGTDFKFDTASGAGSGPVTTTPNYNLPVPTQTPNERITVAAALGGLAASPRVAQFCPDTSKCFVAFYGSNNMPTARLSSASIFAQDFADPQNVTLVGPKQGFAQNAFTYNYAATDLIPLATRYSAGLINYFFRGEMQVRLPAEGVYGIIDGGDPASNCKDACGFKKLKVRVSNVTVPINGVAQDFVGGTMTAVVKFSRNTCFQSDFSADPGPLFPFNPSCFVTGGEPVEEQVTADPSPAPFSLASGSEAALTLNFTNPIPVNAWNIKLQFIYRGQMGQELDAVAVHTKRLSSPTPLRYENEYDYLLINQKLYTRAEVNASQTLLSQVVPVSCVTGAAGSRQLVASCFNPQTIPTSWTGTNGVVLTSLNALPTNSHAMWVFLIDYFGQTSASFPGPAGTISSATFFARDLISLDADSTQVGGDFLIQWRNLQVWQNFSRYYLASTDQTAAPASVSNQRPAFPTTTPVKMTTVNF